MIGVNPHCPITCDNNELAITNNPSNACGADNLLRYQRARKPPKATNMVGRNNNPKLGMPAKAGTASNADANATSPHNSKAARGVIARVGRCRHRI